MANEPTSPLDERYHPPIGSNCRCVWVAPGDGMTKVMTRRHPACKLHGDSSAWWERTKDQAAALSRKRGK